MRHEESVAQQPQYREIAVAIPMSTAAEMWRRARQWDINAGGRFDAQASMIVLWSGTCRHRADPPKPVGALLVRWHMPTDDEATVYRLVWNPAHGGSEAELWHALELLAGVPSPTGR